MHGVLRLRCGRAWLGWPAAEVHEILTYQPPTPLPRAPSHIAGLVVLDGRVVTVLDVVPLLELDSDPAPPTRLVVVDMGGEAVAVVAHEVSGVLEDPTAEQAQALHGNPVLSAVTERVAKVQDALLWCLNTVELNRLTRERT